ncbi:MAG: hypothetical protein E7Z93_05145 [Cyanobacteria bacterium SIG32]|nr:hypothetical protein [Cyanobacteria bacterium SIG32]
MKIHPISQNRLNFKSREYKDDGILGYDDSISKQRRDNIRAWQETYYTPYKSIYEKECNLSEFEMKQLLDGLMKKPKVVDYNKVTGIDAYNVRSVDSQEINYRGSTLAHNPKALKTLKGAGIERVIDLVGYHWYDKNAKEAGLEYYCPKFGRGQLGVWEEEAFVTRGEFWAKETMYYTPIEFEKNKKYLENRMQAFDRHARTSVERFVEYIEVMQKGYYYIGCEYGTYKTDDYLLLNTVFNPKSEEKFIPFGHMFKLDFMKNLYDKLTPEDKKRMGWTKEFDESVPKRLDEAINANIEYHKERDQW